MTLRPLASQIDIFKTRHKMVIEVSEVILEYFIIMKFTRRQYFGLINYPAASHRVLTDIKHYKIIITSLIYNQLQLAGLLLKRYQ